jgi:hypothetical protein
MKEKGVKNEKGSVFNNIYNCFVGVMSRGLCEITLN